jgi:hypothetical protein
VTFRNRPTRALLACLGATILLTACGQGSPEAGHPNTAPPPPSSANTQSGAPTQSAATLPPSAMPSGPPARPANANGLTLAAAAQFVHYYNTLLNYAAETGDTAPLLGASDAGCENCKSYASFVAQANVANSLLKGDFRERITDVPELYRGDSGRVGGAAIVTVGAYVSQKSKTATPRNIPAAKYRREFALSPQAGNWVMYEMKLVKQ